MYGRFMSRVLHQLSSSKDNRLWWKPSKWQAHERNCHTNTIRWIFVYPKMAQSFTNRKIWAKCYVAIVLWILRMICVWLKMSTVNCYAIEKINHWIGTMSNQQKSPSVFNMNIMCICMFFIAVFVFVRPTDLISVTNKFTILCDFFP